MSVITLKGIHQISTKNNWIRCFRCTLKVDRDGTKNWKCRICQELPERVKTRQCDRCKRTIPESAFFYDLDDCAFCFLYNSDQPERNRDVFQRIIEAEKKESQHLAMEAYPIPQVSSFEDSQEEHTLVLGVPEEHKAEFPTNKTKVTGTKCPDMQKIGNTGA